MFAFGWTVRVALAHACGQAVEGGCLGAAVFAGVLRLLVAFVEGVLSTIRTVGMTLTTASGQALDRDGFCSAVFAIKVRHGGERWIEDRRNGLRGERR